ncbi:MAG: zinc ribbon domain-containing protein [Acidobacteriota bacterium]
MNKKIDALRLLFSIDSLLREKEEGTAEAAAESLKRRRTSVRRKIPKPLLKSYDALLDAGRYPPVVEARGAHCSGCNLRLTPQLAHEIRRGEGLLPCPHCRRLLFHDRSRLAFDSGRPAAARTGVLRPAATSDSAALTH